MYDYTVASPQNVYDDGCKAAMCVGPEVEFIGCWKERIINI